MKFNNLLKILCLSFTLFTLASCNLNKPEPPSTDTGTPETSDKEENEYVFPEVNSELTIKEALEVYSHIDDPSLQAGPYRFTGVIKDLVKESGIVISFTLYDESDEIFVNYNKEIDAVHFEDEYKVKIRASIAKLDDKATLTNATVLDVIKDHIDEEDRVYEETDLFVLKQNPYMPYVKVKAVVTGFCDNFLYIQDTRVKANSNPTEYERVYFRVFTGYALIPEKYRAINTKLEISGYFYPNDTFGSFIDRVHFPKDEPTKKSDCRIIAAPSEIENTYEAVKEINLDSINGVNFDNYFDTKVNINEAYNVQSVYFPGDHDRFFINLKATTSKRENIAVLVVGAVRDENDIKQKFVGKNIKLSGFLYKDLQQNAIVFARYTHPEIVTK